jgi:hypothetical protein
MDVPKDFEQCYDFFKQFMSLQDQQELINTAEKDLILFHHSTGQWIRNSWKLWEDKSPFREYYSLSFSNNSQHPDDISMHIIRYCWNRFRADDSKVDREQVRIETKPW